MELRNLEKIEIKLSQQGLRYPVYKWVREANLTAKFEQFLSGKRVLHKNDLKKGHIREAIARQAARLHSAGLFWLNILQLYKTKKRC